MVFKVVLCSQKQFESNKSLWRICIVGNYKVRSKKNCTRITLLPISEFVLDEKFQRNASKLAISYIYVQKPNLWRINSKWCCNIRRLGHFLWSECIFFHSRLLIMKYLELKNLWGAPPNIKIPTNAPPSAPMTRSCQTFQHALNIKNLPNDLKMPTTRGFIAHLMPMGIFISWLQK